ncbi:hypothetical protein GX51_01988 [Blastomyces parvus]|uniref:Uncharacterized protein n=1 Tax=Blastomyces parvus TaxID=2060905 RepID=A0A2B7XEM0_9EURO|nr:hypothetical protein GX51_01988 [Blastomyces parvus]
MSPSMRSFRSVSTPSSRPPHEPRTPNRTSKRFSLGIFSALDLSRSSSTATTASGKETPQFRPTSNKVDTLPDDQTKLEEIANYHLGQIGRLKDEMAHCDEQIDILTFTRLPDGMECIAGKHNERIQAARDWLDLLGKFKDFHWQEFDRIMKLKKQLMAKASGKVSDKVSDNDPSIWL